MLPLHVSSGDKRVQQFHVGQLAVHFQGSARLQQCPFTFTRPAQLPMTLKSAEPQCHHSPTARDRWRSVESGGEHPTSPTVWARWNAKPVSAGLWCAQHENAGRRWAHQWPKRPSSETRGQAGGGPQEVCDGPATVSKQPAPRGGRWTLCPDLLSSDKHALTTGVRALQGDGNTQIPSPRGRGPQAPGGSGQSPWSDPPPPPPPPAPRDRDDQAIHTKNMALHSGRAARYRPNSKDSWNPNFCVGCFE